MEYFPVPPPKTQWTVGFIEPSSGRPGQIELVDPLEGANEWSFEGTDAFTYEVANPVGNIYSIIVGLAD